MSVFAYFEKTGNEAATALRIRLMLDGLQAMKRDEPVYASTGEYDPVLRSHCGLDAGKTGKT